jgi:hypothetical protein
MPYHCKAAEASRRRGIQQQVYVHFVPHHAIPLYVRNIVARRMYWYGMVVGYHTIPPPPCRGNAVEGSGHPYHHMVVLVWYGGGRETNRPKFDVYSTQASSGAAKICMDRNIIDGSKVFSCLNYSITPGRYNGRLYY